MNERLFERGTSLWIFPLPKIDQSLYKLTRFFMIVSGLWKNTLSNNIILQKLYDYYSVFIQALFISLNVLMIIRVFELMGKGATSQIIYTSVTLTILACEINYKVLIYIKNGIPYMILNVIDRERGILANPNEEITRSYLKQAKYYITTSSVQCSITFGGICWFVFFNFYKKSHNLFVPDESFMYEIWVPFDKKKYDILIIIYNVVLAFIGFFFSSAIQTTLQTLTVFAASQLRILQIRLRQMFDSSTGAQYVDIATAKDLIREHQFLIEFVSSLNNAIKYITLLEFVLESINGAAAVLQIVSVDTVFEVVFSCLYLAFIMMNLLIMTWNCNEIIVQSGNVAIALYESNWMDQTGPVKKLLHIMQLRAQTPLCMTIGPFGPMNTERCLMTIKGAYSYANLLLQAR